MKCEMTYGFIKSKDLRRLHCSAKSIFWTGFSVVFCNAAFS